MDFPERTPYSALNWMALRDEFEKTGYWMFRNRSWLPLLGTPLLVWACVSFTYLGGDHWVDEMWHVLCLLVSLSGLALRGWVAGTVPKHTSGRRRRGPRAQKLNTRGLYSALRHPLYTGNYLIVLGIVLFFHNLQLLLWTTALFVLFYERIVFAEEDCLRRRFGPLFESWAAKTPAILPRLKNWRPPELKFSWRKVLRREYPGLFGILLTFSVLEFVTDWRLAGSPQIDQVWWGALTLASVFWLVVRLLKKRTRLLAVADQVE